MSEPNSWQINARHWRWEYLDERGRVLYWISSQAVGTEFDSRTGFVAQTGERIPPLPPEAYDALPRYQPPGSLSAPGDRAPVRGGR